MQAYPPTAAWDKGSSKAEFCELVACADIMGERDGALKGARGADSPALKVGRNVYRKMKTGSSADKIYFFMRTIITEKERAILQD